MDALRNQFNRALEEEDIDEIVDCGFLEVGSEDAHQLCTACLCATRTTRTLDDVTLKQYYMNILTETQLEAGESVLQSLRLCWECVAHLKRLVSFREQVQDSYRLLQPMLLMCDKEDLEFLQTSVCRPCRLRTCFAYSVNISPQDDDAQTMTAEQHDDEGAEPLLVQIKAEGEDKQLQGTDAHPRKQARTSFNELSSTLRSAIGREEQGTSGFLELDHPEMPSFDLETPTEPQSHKCIPQVRDRPLLEASYNIPIDTSTVKRIRSERRENQVVTLCEATAQGRAILKACQRSSKSGPLDTKLRNQLCAYIITQLTPADVNVKLPENHQLLQISQDIARLCESESAELYYCPSISRGKFTPRKNMSGWLVNARNNRKKTLVCLGFLKPPAKPPAKRARSPCPDAAGSPAPPSPEAQEAIDLSHLEEGKLYDIGEVRLVQTAIDRLTGHIEGVPWPTIEKLWSETVRARLYSCYCEKGKVQEYINRYPVLKRSDGWRLLVRDFDALYPAAADGLATCLQLVPQILSHAQNKSKLLKDKFVVATIKNITEQCMISDDDDVKMTGAVILLGCLYKISPAATRKGGTGSRPELLKSLLSFVPSDNDVTAAIQAHALAAQGPFQPFIIAVGQPYNIISSVFFCLTENTFWKFKSFPEALDAGFKIMHAVASPYPTSCCSTWLAIQIAFYHIKTMYDDCSRSLKQLLLDLGLASTLHPYLALK